MDGLLKTRLAGLGHGQTQVGTLAAGGVATRLALVEQLQGLHSCRSAKAVLIGIVIVIVVGLFVFLDSIYHILGEVPSSRASSSAVHDGTMG